MGSKLLSFINALLSISKLPGRGVFHEAYKATKFDAPFTPSYSQAGEDLVLSLILNKNSTLAFYIDIGAHDPNRFSVTRKLYESGWRGIDVDGNADYEVKFREFRPRNQFLNVCVGSQATYKFTIFNEGAISSVNNEWINRFKAEGHPIKSIVAVRGMKLREILDLPGVPKRVSLINIDVEGADEDALRSIEFETLPKDRYPEWLLLETSPPISHSLEYPAVILALKHGYLPWVVLPTATLLKAPEE